VWLDTFETSHEAAHAFNAVAWRFSHSRRDMNFSEIGKSVEVEILVLEVHIASWEESQHHRTMRQISVTEADERAMAKHMEELPEDVQAKHEFYAKRDSDEEGRKAKDARGGWPLGDVDGPR
jgi:hypothetical protein